ncbi:MAG: HAD-IC family P-type ATPase, partial [Candidatus Limnocylindrales bacterium]
MTEPLPPAFDAALAHGTPALEVAAALGVDAAVGLSGPEVEARAAAAGPNELEPRRHASIISMILEAAAEPFMLLLGAAGLAAILLGEVRDGVLILIALLPIIGADVVTEYRGDRALEALRDASAPVARVRRAAVAADVPAATLVAGDVVLLRAGDIVPADLRISRSDRMLVDRSVLTGESVPEPVAVAPDRPAAMLAERRSMAYAGTSVVGGRGEGLVVSIGAGTEVGRIAGGLTGRQSRRSPVQQELDRLVRILLGVAIVLIAIVTGLGFLRGQTLGENLLAGISAAIAAIPEEPPVLLAVVLGLGAFRLLKRGVLVRRLNAQEVLGAVDLIVTDKTGTLTLNRLDISSVRTAAGPVTDRTIRAAILRDALRAEADAWARADGIPAGSFTRAIDRALDGEGISTALDPDELISADPPTGGRPVSITVTRREGIVERLATGAPEAVLAMDGTTDGAALAAWHAQVDEGATAGERLIGIARAPAGGHWSMVALIGFADPLRKGIGGALREARDAGIQTIVVTGDHPATAAAIARAAGLADERIVTGSEVATWDDAHLAAQLPTIDVVARSTPEQKERIVRVARGEGRIVVVTGDGVNDAPALHNADVAVAMGSGTAVAREAADLVLGDDSFVTLLYALREGRRLVDNIQKGLVFLVSTHLAFLGFVLIATIAGYGQPL